MKKYTIVLLALALCLVMTACGAPAASQPQSTPAVTTQPGTTAAATLPATDPATQPTEPVTQPVTTAPTQPTTAPTQPETEPTTVPTQPETQPTEPPTQPATQPTEPEEPAVQGVTKLDPNTLKLGSQMPDIQLTDVKGNTYTLYALLEEKDMVMLNFWYEDCPYCVMEFPYLQLAYKKYQDQVEVFALNPYDTASEIKRFGKNHGLTFRLCQDTLGATEAFSLRGFPTTVVIDREGVVCLFMEGGVTDPVVFQSIFAHFTADDYVSKPLNSYLELFQ